MMKAEQAATSQAPPSKLKGMFGKKGKEVLTPPVELPPPASAYQQHIQTLGELLAVLQAERLKLSGCLELASRPTPASPALSAFMGDRSPAGLSNRMRSSSAWSIGSENESIYHDVMAPEFEFEQDSARDDYSSAPDLSSVSEASGAESDDEEAASNASATTASDGPPAPVRRTHLPAGVTGEEASIMSILRKNMGKDLSRITMPISFNEPLSALQRLAEEFESTSLLHQAARTEDPIDRICLVAAFLVSGMAPQRFRKVRK
jgi:hypothetical protein